MELTTKQKRHLKSLAQTEKAIFQIGKGQLSDNLLDGLDKALEARELIKIHLLQSFEGSVDALVVDLCSELGCYFVQKIGRMVIIYRPSKQHLIQLPK